MGTWCWCEDGEAWGKIKEMGRERDRDRDQERHRDRHEREGRGGRENQWGLNHERKVLALKYPSRETSFFLNISAVFASFEHDFYIVIVILYAILFLSFLI